MLLHPAAVTARQDSFMLVLSQPSELTWWSCSNAKETFVDSQVQKFHHSKLSKKLAISFRIIYSVYQQCFAIKRFLKKFKSKNINFYSGKVMRKKKRKGEISYWHHLWAHKLAFATFSLLIILQLYFSFPNSPRPFSRQSLLPVSHYFSLSEF